MNYKSTVFLLLTLIVLMPINLRASSGPSLLPPASGLGNNPELPPGMSEEDMKMFAEFIDSLDPETIKALEEIGEGIIKQAEELSEELGYTVDPFEYIEMQAQKEQNEKPPKPFEPRKSSEKQAPAAPSSTAEAQSIQEVFKGIAKVISEILQKASSDINLSNEILPFKYRFDDLRFYATALSHDKVLKYLTDPSFASLNEHAKKLYKELVSLNDQLTVPEFSLEGENAYEVLDIPRTASQKDIVTAYDKISKITDPDLIELQLIKEGKTDQEIKIEADKARKRFDTITDAYMTLRSKEEAKIILEHILNIVAQAVDSDKILEEAKKVLQKFDPEAANLKKEQEKIEAEARKKQEEFLKKRPIVSRSFSMPRPSKGGSGKRSKFSDDFGDGGEYTPSGSSKKDKKDFKPTQLPTGKKGNSGTKKDDKKKDDKKKKDTKKNGKKDEGAKKPGAAAKDGEKKEGRKEEVSIEIGGLKKEFKDIEELIKNNSVFKKGDKEKEGDKLAIKGQGLLEYLTTPITETTPAENQSINTLMLQLTAKFKSIEKSVKKTLSDTFKDKKEEQKQFKDEAVKLFKKFEESNQYKLGANYLLSDELKPISTGLKMLISKTQESPILPIVSQKRDFILQSSELTPEVASGESAEKPEPYIERLRKAYKSLKKRVGIDEKGKPGQMPAGPTPSAGA